VGTSTTTTRPTPSARLPKLSAHQDIAVHTEAVAGETEVLRRAIEVIGDKAEAMRWMGTPVKALSYATPVSLLASQDGCSQVLSVLGRLEHGVL